MIPLFSLAIKLLVLFFLLLLLFILYVSIYLLYYKYIYMYLSVVLFTECLNHLSIKFIYQSINQSICVDACHNVGKWAILRGIRGNISRRYSYIVCQGRPLMVSWRRCRTVVSSRREHPVTVGRHKVIGMIPLITRSVLGCAGSCFYILYKDK